MAKFASKDSNKEIILEPHGSGTVTVGNATEGKIVSKASQDLVLSTQGNPQTSSITLYEAVNGNIALSPNGTGTVVVSTDLDVDNINIDGNAITSTNTDGNIDLTPNGTGEVNISKVDIDSGTIDGATIATSDVTVGSSKTLDVSAGTLTTSTAQKQAIVTGGQTNQLVPSNLVAYRASGESTPSGWSEYTSVRGRMIVGLPSGGTDGGAVGTEFGNTENKTKVGSHVHTGPSHQHGNAIRSVSEIAWNNVPPHGTSGSITISRYANEVNYSQTGVEMNTSTGGTGNTGSGGVDVNTGDLLAYVQLMAIKKD